MKQRSGIKINLNLFTSSCALISGIVILSQGDWELAGLWIFAGAGWFGWWMEERRFW